MKKGHNLALRRQKPRIYDEEIYTNFGEQPYLFEIQIGYGLILLVDKGYESNFLKEITYCRNQIDAEYGLPVPAVRIRDNLCLEPDEYSILFNGVEVGKSSVRLGYQLCIDTGNVTNHLDCSFRDKTKDPVFGMDAFYVSDEEVEKYKSAGYVCVLPEKVIGTHLYEIIRKKRSRILNQNLVNTLVEKVRIQNPDVISDVFFYHQFAMSDMKILLNFLLEEEVSIRDMNTILETLADNLQDCSRIYELVEKVREHLSFSFIQNYVDENKVLHVFTVSEKISQLLADHAYFPKIKEELPYAALAPEDRRNILKSFSNSVTWFSERNLLPVLVCVSDVRRLVFTVLHREIPGVRVVSDKELLALGSEITIEVEGEVLIDDKK